MNTDIESTGSMASGPVRKYVSCVNADAAAMDINHEYSSLALSKLIQAIKAKAPAFILMFRQQTQGNLQKGTLS